MKGQVITLENQKGYIGAKRPTNNTGELTAIAKGIRNELDLPPAKRARIVCIETDSTYAMLKILARKKKAKAARKARKIRNCRRIAIL